MAPPPPPRAEWARFGRFAAKVPDSQDVRCGVCLTALPDPHAKADHLRTVHGARVRTIVDPSGRSLYEWSRA
jgi:hypothetical protein